jgi:hypothetical protein
VHSLEIDAAETYLGGGAGPAGLPVLARLAADRAATGEYVSGTSAAFDAANESLFDQFGNAKTTAEPAWTANLSWRSTLNATPLLMILALERIAAGNSRRAHRDDALVSGHWRRRRSTADKSVTRRSN